MDIIKILLIDDHVLFRDGILLLLEGLNAQVEIFEAGSYESAQRIIDEKKTFDLVLLDLGLPGISNIELLMAIRDRLPESSVVVLSGTCDHHVVEQALHHGARGYITKSSSAKIMLNALQLVISGGIYIPPEILENKMSEVNDLPLCDGLEKLLTPRQCDVLFQLAEGKSNKEIGRVLGLTESTVRAHVAAILKAFNVSNRTHAVQYAMQHDWIKLARPY